MGRLRLRDCPRMSLPTRSSQEPLVLEYNVMGDVTTLSTGGSRDPSNAALVQRRCAFQPQGPSSSRPGPSVLPDAHCSALFRPAMNMRNTPPSSPGCPGLGARGTGPPLWPQAGGFPPKVGGPRGRGQTHPHPRHPPPSRPCGLAVPGNSRTSLPKATAWAAPPAQQPPADAPTRQHTPARDRPRPPWTPAPLRLPATPSHPHSLWVPGAQPSFRDPLLVPTLGPQLSLQRDRTTPSCSQPYLHC